MSNNPIRYSLNKLATLRQHNEMLLDKLNYTKNEQLQTAKQIQDIVNNCNHTPIETNVPVIIKNGYDSATNRQMFICTVCNTDIDYMTYLAIGPQTEKM